MQSMGVYSLNNDTPTSYSRLGHTPFFLKLTPTCTVWHKGAPICPSTASPGAKTLCIHPIWMWDAVNGGSQPQNIIQARPYPIFAKTHPHLHTYYSIKMHPFDPPQHLEVLKYFVYINLDVGCSQWGFAASTMTSQHHAGSKVSAIPHFP